MIRILHTLLLYLVVFLPNSSHALSCEYVDPKVAIQSSKFVFIGFVKSVTNDLVTLQIRKSFKSPIGSEVEIAFPQMRALGERKPSYFKVGESYLIIHGSDLSKTQNGKSQFILGLCETALNTTDAKEIIKWLNSKEFMGSKKGLSK